MTPQVALIVFGGMFGLTALVVALIFWLDYRSKKPQYKLTMGTGVRYLEGAAKIEGLDAMLMAMYRATVKNYGVAVATECFDGLWVWVYPEDNPYLAPGKYAGQKFNGLNDTTTVFGFMQRTTIKIRRISNNIRDTALVHEFAWHLVVKHDSRVGTVVTHHNDAAGTPIKPAWGVICIGLKNDCIAEYVGAKS